MKYTVKMGSVVSDWLCRRVGGRLEGGWDAAYGSLPGGPATICW